MKYLYLIVGRKLNKVRGKMKANESIQKTNRQRNAGFDTQVFSAAMWDLLCTEV